MCSSTGANLATARIVSRPSIAATSLLSRPVGGLACRIRITVRQYHAVAVVARETTNVIRLMHPRQPTFRSTCEVKDFADAEEYCDRLAEFLDLPALTLAGDKNWDDAMSGTLKRAARRKANRGKRAALPRPPAAGNVVAFRAVEGREIIARH